MLGLLQSRLGISTMDARGLVDDLFAATKSHAARGRDMAEGRLGIPEAGHRRAAMLDGIGKGPLQPRSWPRYLAQVPGGASPPRHPGTHAVDR